MKGAKNKELLSLDEISALRNKYIGEPYSIHVSYTEDKQFKRVRLVRWYDGVFPRVLASMVMHQCTNDLWEVDDVAVLYEDYKGSGKVLYYVAMQHIYPAYLMPSSNGVTEDSKRVYDAFEQLDYVESLDLFEEWRDSDFWLDGYGLINRMYRFRFPS